MAIGEGFGASITFGTNMTTINAINIQEVGITRADIDLTHHGTTTGYKVFTPAANTDPGTLQVTWLYDPDTQPPFTATSETITVTYPSTKNNGATSASTGYVSSWDGPDAAMDQRMEATMTIKRSGVITFVDAST